MAEASLGQQIDKLFRLREKITKEQKKVDELKQQRNELEEQVIAQMKEQGDLEQARSNKATATRTISVVPHVKDWQKLYRYILRNKALHLFERRVSSAAYRELMESRKGRKLPGVDSFHKETLSLRKRSE